MKEKGTYLNNINKLQQEITSLEEQAGTIGTVTPLDYEALYNILVKAYFKAKDIIELQQTPTDNSAVATLEVGLEVANKEIAALSTKITTLTTNSAELNAKLDEIAELAK